MIASLQPLNQMYFGEISFDLWIKQCMFCLFCCCKRYSVCIFFMGLSRYSLILHIGGRASSKIQGLIRSRNGSPLDYGSWGKGRLYERHQYLSIDLSCSICRLLFIISRVDALSTAVYHLFRSMWSISGINRDIKGILSHIIGTSVMKYIPFSKLITSKPNHNASQSLSPH